MMYNTKLKQEKKNECRSKNEVKLSWLQIFAGVIFLVCGSLLLTFNELSAIETNKSLSNALQDLRIVNNIWKIEQINNGALIYLNGVLHVGEPLTEPEYGISVPAVILKRRVQMYQWVEDVVPLSLTGMKEDSATTAQYSYYTSWRDKLIDSSKFHIQHGHHNPTKFPVKSHLYLSHTVKIGAFILSTELKWKFTDFTVITSDERPERHDIKMHSGLYYHTANVWNPHVGDLRIQFSYAGMSGDAVSIIARQHGNLLSGEDMIFLEKGKVCAENMIKNQHDKNIWLMRSFRSISWFFLYMATSCFTCILETFAIKFRRIFQFVILDGILSPNIAFSVALFALIVSAIWLSYKPWISLSIILGFSTPGIISSIYKQFRSPENSYHLF